MFLKGPIHKTALIQIMAWCRTIDKPFPEKITQFTDALNAFKVLICWGFSIDGKSSLIQVSAPFQRGNKPQPNKWWP